MVSVTSIEASAFTVTSLRKLSMRSSASAGDASARQDEEEGEKPAHLSAS